MEVILKFVLSEKQTTRKKTIIKENNLRIGNALGAGKENMMLLKSVQE